MNNASGQQVLAASTRVLTPNTVSTSTYQQQLDYINSAISGNNLVKMHDSWIIDTGASSHITNCIDNLINIRKITDWHVLLPNYLKLAATHIGNVHLSKYLVLHDVLFVPTFKYNLFSVTKLSSTSKYELVFTSTDFVIQDPLSKKKIGSAKVYNGLYHLDLDSFCNFSFSTTCNQDEL